MYVSRNEAYGVVSTDIREINNLEMHQMYMMRERIAQVLNSHKDDSSKKEYLNDDELTMLMCILHVLIKDYASDCTSAFDDAMAELKNS